MCSPLNTEPLNTECHIQPVPVWAAYNSVITSGDQGEQGLDEVHPLPLINSQAHEWQTLVTSLTQLHRLNVLTHDAGHRTPFCVWLDMDLYKRVWKLPYLHPQLYSNKWIESPGQFHIVICGLRCLGQTVEGSGLDDLWTQTDLYGNVTGMQIINGNHYSRAIECHLVTPQALSDLWFDAFFERHPSILEALNEDLKKCQMPVVMVMLQMHTRYCVQRC